MKNKRHYVLESNRFSNDSENSNSCTYIGAYTCGVWD